MIILFQTMKDSGLTDLEPVGPVKVEAVVGLALDHCKVLQHAAEQQYPDVTHVLFASIKTRGSKTFLFGDGYKLKAGLSAELAFVSSITLGVETGGDPCNVRTAGPAEEESYMRQHEEAREREKAIRQRMGLDPPLGDIPGARKIDIEKGLDVSLELDIARRAATTKLVELPWPDLATGEPYLGGKAVWECLYGHRQIRASKWTPCIARKHPDGLLGVVTINGSEFSPGNPHAPEAFRCRVMLDVGTPDDEQLVESVCTCECPDGPGQHLENCESYLPRKAVRALDDIVMWARRFNALGDTRVGRAGTLRWLLDRVVRYAEDAAAQGPTAISDPWQLLVDRLKSGRIAFPCDGDPDIPDEYNGAMPHDHEYNADDVCWCGADGSS